MSYMYLSTQYNMLQFIHLFLALLLVQTEMLVGEQVLLFLKKLQAVTSCAGGSVCI